MSEQELREKLAAIEHERWSDWQAWCHKILRENCPSPELEKILERWDRQIATPYDKLSDQEKASDMEQVDRYWPLIAALVARREALAQQDLANMLLDKVYEFHDQPEICLQILGEYLSPFETSDALTTEATQGGEEQ